jgi:hypothetical protein
MWRVVGLVIVFLAAWDFAVSDGRHLRMVGMMAREILMRSGILV